MTVDLDRLGALEKAATPGTHAPYRDLSDVFCNIDGQRWPCQTELIAELRELRGIAEAARQFYKDILRSKEVPTIYRVCAEQHLARLARYDAQEAAK